jgi:hypothetical protein
MNSRKLDILSITKPIHAGGRDPTGGKAVASDVGAASPRAAIALQHDDLTERGRISPRIADRKANALQRRAR